MLERIQSSSDLKQLNDHELTELCEEIRHELIRTVSENGGHLASNLGVVELTVALHKVFNTPEDKIVFDVGHQSYVHKMITGRYSRFGTLRKFGGLSGFPKRAESEYDCYETGHASTAISAALGLARARDYLHQDHRVIAVVGDGAMTGGMCYEALNDAGNARTQLTVILNDNEMSIAPNVGALSSYLTHLRISAGWQSTKKKVRRLSGLPVFGKMIYRVIHGVKKILKSVILRNSDVGFFEALGFQYFGPINGHDLRSLEETLEQAKKHKGPCVIHVLTKKGYGYEEAEKRPEAFHGTPPDCPSAGHRMADKLSEMAEKDYRVIAITAAMPLGTGLDHFGEKYPDRLIDVGIAEEHAATMAAGLAAGGMRPYFAVYSSFFQRCYDQMIHDVCMQHLPVVFLLDRSGIGGEDGQTHHGVFDYSALIPIPGITVLSPADADELCEMLSWTICQDGPVAIRYCKDGDRLPSGKTKNNGFIPGRWDVVVPGKDVKLLAAGGMVRTALTVTEDLRKQGIDAEVVNCSSIKPLDEEYLNQTGSTPVITLEEHMTTGGFGEYVTERCRQLGLKAPVDCIGISDMFIPHGKHSELLEYAGLSANQLIGRIMKKLGRTEA